MLVLRRCLRDEWGYEIMDRLGLLDRGLSINS
jgi:hypothetical protein